MFLSKGIFYFDGDVGPKWGDIDCGDGGVYGTSGSTGPACI